jgi:hypothetical protein
MRKNFEHKMCAPYTYRDCPVNVGVMLAEAKEVPKSRRED